MKILGVDPGLAQTGWAILEKDSKNTVLVKCGCIETNSKIALQDRLNVLYNMLNKILMEHKPGLIAIEKQFLYQKSQTVLHTSEARGIILLLAAQKNIRVKEYNPKEVKIAVTGYGAADKEQVHSMVKRLLRVENIPKPDDISDAIAVGICHLNSFTPKADTV